MEGDKFLGVWHQVMTIGAIAFIFIALLIYVVYKIRLASIADFKGKYDFIRQNEIKVLQWTFYTVGVAVMMIANTYGRGSLEFDWGWFLVRLFIALAGGTLVGYVASLVFKYYYPTRVHRKLNKWRYMSRTNPNTGNKMKLLGEDEEDLHLDEGMQAEENIFSVDYDVWMDPVSKEVRVEKYPGHLEAVRCNNCGFYTMKVVLEEIIEAPTTTSKGQLVKNYKCEYCKSIRATQFTVARLQEGDQYTPQKVMYRTNQNVDLVKLEIHGISGEWKSYEFQNLEQARNFLEEYERENAAS